MAFPFFRVGALLLLFTGGLRAVETGAAATALPPAIKALITRAESGDSEASEELGRAYARGEGVAADPLEAARWLAKNFSAQPSPAVQELLLELSVQHPDLADRYLAKHSPAEVRALAAKAKTGDRAARFELSQRQFSGDGVLLDYDRALSAMSKLAAEGHAPAQYEMSVRAEDEAEAKAWLEKSAAQNFAPALFQHGANLVWSSDDADQARGHTLVEKAAAAGHGPAMLFLARHYRDFENNPKALEWGNRALDASTEGAQEFVTELLADMRAERERATQVAAKPPAPAVPPPVAAKAPVSAPTAGAQTTLPPAAPATNLPPALTTDANGLLVLPPHQPLVSPIALERALRQGWAGAASQASPSKARGTALAQYYTAALASDLPATTKTGLLRERIDELALLDFYALLELQFALPNDQAVALGKNYFTAAQRADVRKVMDASTAAYVDKKANTYAGFPPGRGWAEPELTAAKQALAANNHAAYVAALQKAAAKGSPGAMVSLAECYRNATGVTADPVQAARWLHLATTKNHGPAMLELANYLEAGVGVATNTIAARDWRTTARNLRPTAPAQPRVNLYAEASDFRRYLTGTWLVEIKLNANNTGKPLVTHFKFAPAAGTDFTLTTDARSNAPASTRAWTIRQTSSDWQGTVYDEIHFDYVGTRFSGTLSAGNLRGNLNKGGYSTGTWSAGRRIDLDYYDLGTAAMEQKRYDDAVHYFTQAINVRPDALYFSLRGNAYYALYDYEPSIADYTVALRTDPKNLNTLYNRALAYHYSGKHAEAIADTTQVLTPPLTMPAPRQAAVYRTRALAHARLGDDEAAQKDFTESRRLNPDQPQTREEALVAMSLRSTATNQALNNLNQSLTQNTQQLAAANQALREANAGKTSPTTPTAAGTARPSLEADLDAIEAARLFAEAFKEYQAQNYGAAFKGFTAAAALGNSTAMFNLGVMHEQGQGTAKNFEEAVAWFEKSAAAGHNQATPEFLARYRERLDFHRGLTAYNAKNFPLALTTWKKAADAGNASAMFNLSVMHEHGEGTAPDPAAALAWLEKAVAAGYKQPVDAITKRLKGRIAGAADYQQGDAAEKANELVAARGAYEKAAAAGNVPALARLGYFYHYGITVMADEKKAQEFYQRATDGGDSFARMQLDMLKSGSSMQAMLDSQREMKRLARSVDGQGPAKISALSTATPTQAEIDALIKKSPWTVAEVRAALQRRVKHRALAVALATDKMTDLYDSEYQAILALPEMQHREDYDRLNMVLLENRKPGAGQWAKDAARAAVAARRAQLGALPPRPIDSAELRAKALAGDVAALYAISFMGEKQRTLGPLSPDLTKKSAELKTLIQQQQFKPAYWLLDEGLVYNTDKSKVNVAQAVAYYRASAEAGDARGAEKLASAFIAPGEVGVARNYLEAEQWFIEAAARGTDDDFPGMKPEFALYLLYSYITPIGFTGMSMPTDDDALRWARELIRRGGKFAEHAKLSLENQGKELNNTDLLARLAALPPEVPPFPAAELAKLETAARAGDVPALLKLADAYATGRGVRQHDQKALEYFQAAAAKGSAPAMRRLAQSYQKGHGVKPDEATRITWLRKAGDAGDAKALMEVGPLLKGAEMLAAYEKAAALGEKDALQRVANAHRYGWGGIPKDGQKFIAAMQQAIAAGYLGGYTDIARYYEGERDKPNALAWWRKAVEAGDKNSRDELASALFSAGDKDAARAVYLELAEDGNVPAQMMTASFFAGDGDDTNAEQWYRRIAAGPPSEDQKRAARFAQEYAEERTAAPGTLPYFRRLAQKGDLNAMVQFARLLAPTDRDAAMRWLRRAADEGHAMGTAMLVGELAKTKREDAVAWVKAAAEKGNTQAQLILALELAATDKPAALAGIEKAANAGNAEAKYRLGMMLFNGTELAKDATRGLALVKASADAGFPAAQTDYGRALVVGLPGVTADPATGLGYLEKAAAQQFPQALALLGEIHERGAGVPANPRKALEYYQAAQKLGVTQVAPAIQRVQLQLSGKMPPPAPIKK